MWTIGDVLGDAWRDVSREMGVLALATLVWLVIVIVISVGFVVPFVIMMQQAGPGGPPPVGALGLMYCVFYPALFLVQCYFTAGASHIALNTAAGNSPTVSDLFAPLGLALRVTGAFFLVLVLTMALGLVLSLGSGLLAIPFLAMAGSGGEPPVAFMILIFGGVCVFYLGAFYLWGVFALVPFVLVDQDVGLVRALQQSATYTAGHRLKIFLLFILFLLFSQFVPCTCYLGMLLLVPWFFLTGAHIYLESARDDGSVVAGGSGTADYGLSAGDVVDPSSPYAPPVANPYGQRGGGDFSRPGEGGRPDKGAEDDPSPGPELGPPQDPERPEGLAEGLDPGPDDDSGDRPEGGGWEPSGY